MDYQVVRNKEEYLELCKGLLTESVGEDDFGTFVPFDCYEEWANYFGAVLPLDEEKDEYLPIESFSGNLLYSPEESEYPVIVVQNFELYSDFRNGDLGIRMFEWKCIQELSLVIDEEEVTESKAVEIETFEKEEIEMNAFIPFSNKNELLAEEYQLLEQSLVNEIPKQVFQLTGKEAKVTVGGLSNSLLRKADVEFEKNKCLRHRIEIIPSVHLIVTLSHHEVGLGKETHLVSFDGIQVFPDTTPENIKHFSKLFAFTGLC